MCQSDISVSLSLSIYLSLFTEDEDATIYFFTLYEFVFVVCMQEQHEAIFVRFVIELEIGIGRRVHQDVEFFNCTNYKYA